MSARPNIPFELHVALRYLLAKRKQAFISVISLISTIGVAVGVMAVVIALAVMTGLQQELRDRILGSNPHVYVSKVGGIDDYHAEVARLRQMPRVIGAAPDVIGQGLIFAGGSTMPVSIKGVDPALEPSVTDVKTAMQSGSLDALTTRGDDVPGIVLGKDLAASLHVMVGDSVQVLTLEGVLTPMGNRPLPRRRRVVGLFKLGLYEFDSTYAFVSLQDAMRLFDKRQVDFIQLRVDDITKAPQVAATVTKQLGDQYLTEDWTVMNKSLFSALTLEKIAVSLAVGLIVLVAALNIVATLILLVMEKHRDVAILKTMGANARSVTAIFMAQGLLIGLVGTTVGAAAGYALSFVFDRYQLIRMPIDVYQVSHLPFTVLPRDFALVIAVAILICFVATIYPSRQAARLDPAQALRYE
jgi:lipoprotein-releasing system permease protein